MRAGERLEHEVHRELQPGAAGVERPAHLRARAGEVGDKSVVGDVESDLDPERLVGDAVIVDPVLGLECPFGSARETEPRHSLGIVQKALDRLLEDRPAVALEQREQAALADLQRRDARPHVAERGVRQPHVDGEDLEQRLVEHAVGIEPDVRELEALLPDLGGVGRDGRVLAAELAPVTLVGGERDQRAFEEDRHHQADVVQMGAAAVIRVVGHEDIARADRVGRAVLGDHVADRGLQRRDEERQAVALDDHPPLRVREADAEVEHLVHHHAMRGAVQDDEHLVADRLEIVADDLEGERIRHRAGSVAMIRLP